MIQVNNLIKTFDGFKALDGVNMNVKRGSVYGLVGPNGAGKSTLIRHITGVMRPDAGEVFVDGENVYENSSVKSKMAYIPDDMFYFVQSDTIEMMKYYKGMYRNFDEKMFYRLQEFFPAIDVKRNIRKLSKGMQKQVAFWLSLCCRPKLIVLDEPVDGLDPVMRRQVWTFLLDDVTENGTTVMVSSHNLRELEDGEIMLNSIFKFKETESKDEYVKSNKVTGELKKIGKLHNTDKLIAAGLVGEMRNEL